MNYESDSETYAELKSVRSLIKPNWIPNDRLKDMKFKLLKYLEVNAWLRVLQNWGPAHFYLGALVYERHE